MFDTSKYGDLIWYNNPSRYAYGPAIFIAADHNDKVILIYLINNHGWGLYEILEGSITRSMKNKVTAGNYQNGLWWASPKFIQHRLEEDTL